MGTSRSGRGHRVLVEVRIVPLNLCSGKDVVLKGIEEKSPSQGNISFSTNSNGGGLGNEPFPITREPNCTAHAFQLKFDCLESCVLWKIRKRPSKIYGF